MTEAYCYTYDSTGEVLAVIKRPHDDLGEDTFHEWISLDERVMADSLGRPNRRMWGVPPWTKWRCNNTECHAEALVHDAAGRLAIAEAEGP